MLLIRAPYLDLKLEHFVLYRYLYKLAHSTTMEAFRDKLFVGAAAQDLHKATLSIAHNIYCNLGSGGPISALKKTHGLRPKVLQKTLFHKLGLLSRLWVLLLQVFVHGAVGITTGLHPVLQDVHVLHSVDLEALGVGGASIILNLRSSGNLGSVSFFLMGLWTCAWYCLWLQTCPWCCRWSSWGSSWC